MKYELPNLPFSYDALEPYIDEKTMKVHHQGHHKTYVKKLNDALKDFPEYQKPVDELLASLPNLPIEIQEAVRKNGGGHANHTLFWTLLTPEKETQCSDEFSEVLNKHFGTLEKFKEKFTKIASEHFGSGWAWLATDKDGNLKVFSTKDHENPITHGMTALLVLDLWEHAYYLKYQNKRPEFIEAFWNIVNWTEVSARWEEFLNQGGSAREWAKAS